MTEQDVADAVQALVIWAIAAWVVAMGMLTAWWLRRRRDRHLRLFIEEHERTDDWPFR